VQLTDQGRFSQFVAQAKQRKESGIIGSGHSVAASRIDAMDNLADGPTSSWGGSGQPPGHCSTQSLYGSVVCVRVCVCALVLCITYKISPLFF